MRINNASDTYPKSLDCSVTGSLHFGAIYLSRYPTGYGGDGDIQAGVSGALVIRSEI